MVVIRVAVAMHFAMKNCQICFSLQEFLAILSAIEKSLAIGLRCHRALSSGKFQDVTDVNVAGGALRGFNGYSPASSYLFSFFKHIVTKKCPKLRVCLDAQIASDLKLLRFQSRFLR